MKKILSMILVFVCLLAVACPAFAFESNNVMPRYINVSQARNILTISQNGTATVALRCIAKNGTQSICVETQLERKVGNSWVVVDISAANDCWVDTVSTITLVKTHTQQLSASGTYRTVAVFTVTATQTETFTLTSDEVIYTHTP